MDVVYARATASVATVSAGQVLVLEGSHWPADDPIVRANPGLFTKDARTGLQYTVEPATPPDPRRMEQATRAPGERRG